MRVYILLQSSGRWKISDEPKISLLQISRSTRQSNSFVNFLSFLFLCCNDKYHRKRDGHIRIVSLENLAKSRCARLFRKQLCWNLISVVPSCGLISDLRQPTSGGSKGMLRTRLSSNFHAVFGTKCCVLLLTSSGIAATSPPLAKSWIQYCRRFLSCMSKYQKLHLKISQYTAADLGFPGFGCQPERWEMY